jgi:hypothetical protein
MAMTEQEWLACPDPEPMLKFFQRKVSERKLRLFACACARRVRPYFSDRRGWRAVTVAERYADGAATERELQTAFNAAWAAQRKLYRAKPAPWKPPLRLRQW